MARLAALVIALGLLGCTERAPSASGRLWPEADQLFHREPRWVGGDGAYSVPLGGDRVLWLFGDSFIAQGPVLDRSHSRMVRNSVALETGLDPANAFMEFHWPEVDGEPQSFVPEDGASWFWPMHGVVVGSRLLLFYERLGTPAGDPDGFQTDGWSALVVDHPEAPISAWTPRGALLPKSSHDVILGEAALLEEDFLYLYGTRGQRHSVYLARVGTGAAREGDLRSLEWWTLAGWSKTDAPESVVDFGAPELSVHYDHHVNRYLMVHTEGYGGTTLALRAADRPEGPWTPPRDILRPPESSEPDAFVYAGKAHPELFGADLVATYVPSSFADVPREDEDRLYFPHFVRVSF
ncbi:MAG: DUF4185 domain-containing protein [Myxococcales bacterium]|nr:DUF4185 domain-containing protein [Myxococcales bacterium]MCB9575784.1 DUF4185 domain-containing protein [Polyangiaceae bacterium]